MTIELESPTAQTVYEAVKSLPTLERIKLAGLLVSDVSPRDIVDRRNSWTGEDLRDFSDASFALMEKRFEEEENAPRRCGLCFVSGRESLRCDPVTVRLAG